MAFTTDNTLIEGLLDANSFRSGFTSTATSASTLTLTTTSAMVQAFTGVTPGQIVKMPDATTLTVPTGNIGGYRYEIWNQTNNTIVVQDNAGGTLITVQSNQCSIIVCSSNSTAAGTWIIQTFSAASGGNAVIQVRRSTNLVFTSNVYTDVTFDIEDAKNNISYLDHSLVTNTGRILVNQPGYYEVGFFSTFTSTTPGNVYNHRILFNGTTVVPGTASITGDTGNNFLAVQSVYNFTTTGYFTYQVQSVGGDSETDQNVVLYARTINGTSVVAATTTALSIPFSRSGSRVAGDYLLTAGGAVSSNSGQIIPGSSLLSKVGVSVSSAIAGSGAVFQLQQRTAVGTFVDIVGASVTIPVGQYQAVASSLGIQLSADTEISAYLKSGGTSVNPVLTVLAVPQ